MLTFNLKKEWFEKIKSGEKTHEYREFKPYWLVRLQNYFDLRDDEIDEMERGKVYILDDPIAFRCGYNGEKLKAIAKYITIKNGLDTDLKTNKDVFDIEFELIERGKNNDR